MVLDDPAAGATPDATVSFALAVVDVNETPAVSLTPVLSTLAEDADTTEALKVADIAVSDDALGINALSLSGADAGLFEIVGTELYLKAGSTLDFETVAALEVVVEVDDGEIAGAPEASAVFSLALSDVNVAPSLT